MSAGKEGRKKREDLGKFLEEQQLPQSPESVL